MRKLPKEAEGVVLTKSQKAENFWFYNKWNVIGIVVVSIILAIGIYSCATKPNYDITVVLAISDDVTDQSIEYLSKDLEKYCDDFNGDGKVLVNVYNCCFTDERAGLTDNGGSRYTNFVASFTDPENIIYIIDKKRIDYSQITNDLDSSLSLPDLDGKGIRLDGSKFEEKFTENTYLKFTEDTYLVRRALTGKFEGNKKAAKNFKNAESFILKFKERN